MAQKEKRGLGDASQSLVVCVCGRHEPAAGSVPWLQKGSILLTLNLTDNGSSINFHNRFLVILNTETELFAVRDSEVSYIILEYTCYTQYCHHEHRFILFRDSYHRYLLMAVGIYKSWFLQQNFHSVLECGAQIWWNSCLLPGRCSGCSMRPKIKSGALCAKPVLQPGTISQVLDFSFSHI